MKKMLRQKLTLELEQLVEALDEAPDDVDHVLEDFADIAADMDLEPLSELSDYLLILNDVTESNDNKTSLQVKAWLNALRELFSDSEEDQVPDLDALYAGLANELLEHADLKLPPELVGTLLVLLQKIDVLEGEENHPQPFSVPSDEEPILGNEAESRPVSSSLRTQLAEDLQKLGAELSQAPDQADAILDAFAGIGESAELEPLLELSDYLLILNEMTEGSSPCFADWMNALSAAAAGDTLDSQETLPSLYATLKADLQQLAELDINPTLINDFYSSLEQLGSTEAAEASEPAQSAVEDQQTEVKDTRTALPEDEEAVSESLWAEDKELLEEVGLAEEAEPFGVYETTGLAEETDLIKEIELTEDILTLENAPPAEKEESLEEPESIEKAKLHEVKETVEDSELIEDVAMIEDVEQLDSSLVVEAYGSDEKTALSEDVELAEEVVRIEQSELLEETETGEESELIEQTELASTPEQKTDPDGEAYLKVDEDVSQRLVDAFNKETVGQVNVLSEQLAQNGSSPWLDQAALVRLPHSIRGGAAVLKLDALAELATALENALGKHPVKALTDNQLGVLKTAAEQLDRLLNAWETGGTYLTAPLHRLLQQLQEFFPDTESVEEVTDESILVLDQLWLEPKADLDPRLKNSFFLETPDQVTELSQLLQLAADDGEEKIDIDAAMRLAHTIKSSANLAGLSVLQDLAHLLEDLMESLGLRGGISNYKELLSETGDLFSVIGDALELRLEQIEAPVSSIVAKLKLAVEEVAASDADAVPQPDMLAEIVSPSEDEDPFEVLAWAEDAPAEQVDQFFEQAPIDIKRLGEILLDKASYSSEKIAKTLELILQLNQSAGAIGLNVISALFSALLPFYSRFANQVPSADDTQALEKTSAYLIALSDALQGEDEPQAGATKLVASLKKLAKKTPQPVKKTNDKSSPAHAAPEEIIRLPLSTLNHLLSQVGELSSNNTLMRNSLEKTTDLLLSLQQKGSYTKELLKELTLLVETRNLGTSPAISGNDEIDPLEMDQYNALYSQTSAFAEALTDSLVLQRQASAELDSTNSFVGAQERLSREISETVLAARMVSVESLIPRMERTVREASRATGKHVRLQVKGEHLLLDTNVLNIIRDPLMHLLRNAVDHGIEAPDVRLSKGKQEEGSIFLNFIHKGGRILIQVGDDGGGFSLDDIRAAAKRQGLETTNLDSKALLQLLTRPGFTTRRKATNISGRGVGLDVVRTAVEKIKGNLNLEPGEAGGSLFEMLVPITLVSVPSLFVEVSGQIMALPSENVEQILYAEAAQVKSLGNGWSYLHEGQPYMLRSLDDILGRGADSKAVFEEGGVILLLRIQNRAMAIYVKSVLERREVVVQPLSKWLGSVKGVIGACILADGGVGAVLDLSTLLTSEVQMPRLRHSSTTAEMADSWPHQSDSILIVDDSLSAREAAAIVLERDGYQIVTAIDGFDAIRKMEQEVPALALVDMEMPNMNGIELTRHIRSSSELRDLPVVMLTSRSSPKHQEMATSVGVDAYVTKPFDEAELLSTLETLINQRHLSTSGQYS